MDYHDIIMKINHFNVSNFTMGDFNSLNDIIKEIKSIYQKDISNKKLDAKIHYDAVMDHLYTVVFSILKSKLQFEDEVIQKIMYLIDYANDIQDVFVLDGNVFVKVQNAESDNATFLPLDNFFDITSDKFSKSNSNNNFKYLIIQAFNNSVSPWFSDKLGKKRLLSINNGNILYNLLDTNIFIDSSLKSIIESGANHIEKVTKVIIRINDDLYSFDMKLRDEYLILSYNDYPVSKLSELLTSREKTKKL